MMSGAYRFCQTPVTIARNTPSRATRYVLRSLRDEYDE